METYWSIALDDYEQAELCAQLKRNKFAVFHYQQFAEKAAKFLLHKKDPRHKELKSHKVEEIIIAYDALMEFNDITNKARYLTSFYFNTRYPGDNYVSEITDMQVEHAKKCADELKLFFEKELEDIPKNATKIDISGLKPALQIIIKQKENFKK